MKKTKKELFEPKILNLDSPTLKEELLEITNSYKLTKKFIKEVNNTDDLNELKILIHQNLVKFINKKIEIIGVFSYTDKYESFSSYKNGKLHSFTDENGEYLPARIINYGDKIWYKEGLIHRENDLPAIIEKYNKRQEWRINSKLHREGDLPAIIHSNGYCEYYKNGKRHRDDDINGNPQPAVIKSYSQILFFKNGVQFFLTEQQYYIINLESPTLKEDLLNLLDKLKYSNFDTINEIKNTENINDIKIIIHKICNGLYAYYFIKIIGIFSYINNNGIEIHYKDGKYHREGDLPAKIYPSGKLEYYINDELHREGDLPAIIHSSGTQEYYINDKLHRDVDKFGNSQPAIITSDGDYEYYINGKLHREGDLPAVIYDNGECEYWKHGKLHRDNDVHGNPQPAIKILIEEFYQNGELVDKNGKKIDKMGFGFPFSSRMFRYKFD